MPTLSAATPFLGPDVWRIEPSPTGWGDGAMIDHQSERREVLSEWPTITHRAYLVVALRL